MCNALKSNHLQQLAGSSDARTTIETEQLPVVVQRLSRIEKAIEVGLFGQIANPTLDRDVAWVATEHHQSPASAMEKTKNHLNRGRLARSVWAEQTKNLVAIDVKIDPIDRFRRRAQPEIGECLGQADRVNNAFACRSLLDRHAGSSLDLESRPGGAVVSA
jgi:hypothetical protein